jgi:Peptide-N-glycosidase F, C terminal/Peptide-N-glycosidase F, N terminal
MTPVLLAARTTLVGLGLIALNAHSAPGNVSLFDQIPQFGIYVTTPPNYTPPEGVLMFDNGTTFMTRLTPERQAMIGADVAAQVTYHAQCDNYDRLGGLFMVVKPLGVAPSGDEPKVELLRWITPFSNYWQGQYATRVFPAASLAPFAGVLRDRKHDIWIGIKGGSNPYGGDPCSQRGSDADFSAVGFRYSVSLNSTVPATGKRSSVGMPIPVADYTSVPVTGSVTARAGAQATAVVIVSGHGSASRGNEYKHTEDSLLLNGTAVGSFSTQANCAPYRKYSPDGNPFIFLNNNGSNPRNWCPGALVPSHSFPVRLGQTNQFSLDMDDPRVPEGSYYQTSVTLLPK